MRSDRRNHEFKQSIQNNITEGLLNSVQDLFYVFDKNQFLIEYNDKVPEVSGYTPEQLDSMQPLDFFPKEEHDKIEQKLTDVFRKGKQVRVDASYLTADGRKIPYEFEASPLYNDENTIVGFAGIGRDISERKQHERDLKQTQEFLEKTQEVANIGGWEVDLRSNEMQWTKQLYDIYGMDSERSLSPEESLELAHPDDKQKMIDAFERLKADGEPYDLELRIIRVDNDNIRWVRTKGQPYYEDGEIVSVYGTFEDITDRKQREKQLQSRREKVDVVNQIVRHDIRNNLQAVAGYAQTLTDLPDERNDQFIEKILCNANSAIDLTETAGDLVEAVFQTEDNLEPISLKQILETQIQETNTETRKVSITVDGDIPAVQIRADQMLSSVFRNLFQNAVQHSDKEVAEIVVSAERNNGKVVVRIADNGPGVPDDMKEALFEKGEMGLKSDGTGIGLYLVETLIETYSGDVWVEDNNPEGAVFVVELPISTTDSF